MFLSKIFADIVISAFAAMDIIPVACRFEYIYGVNKHPNYKYNEIRLKRKGGDRKKNSCEKFRKKRTNFNNVFDVDKFYFDFLFTLLIDRIYQDKIRVEKQETFRYLFFYVFRDQPLFYFSFYSNAHLINCAYF